MAVMQCDIITPEGMAFSGEAEMVVVPGVEGELGVLPRHQPIIAQLGVGEVRVRTEGGAWHRFAAADGYFSMQGQRAIVLVQGAVAVDAIERETATALRDDARERLQRIEDGEEGLDRFRAELDLAFAENQLRLLGD
jgi:F-type H+-transporting ATPase subunit epsilon